MINKEYKNLKLARELLKKELKNKAGIYQLINMENGKSYIGSSVNLYGRLGQHCSEKNNKKQLLKSKSMICKALLKYGPENFSLVILEFINLDGYLGTIEKRTRIISSQQYFMDEKKPHYNVNPTAGSNLGRIFDEKVRSNMSLAKKGQPSHWLGKKKSQESIDLMIENHGMSKTIHSYNSEGIYLKSYRSIQEAHDDTGIPRKIISKYAKSRPPILLKENIILSNLKLKNLNTKYNISTVNKNNIKLYAYNPDGSLFKVFNSIAEGVLSTKISYKRIVKNANLKDSEILDEKFFFSFEPIN